MDERPVDQVIEARWPYDGPTDHYQVIDAARAIRGLVRYLNNATGPGRGDRVLEWAATSGAVVSGVHGAVVLLDQLLRQVEGRLERQAASDATLYDDRHDRPGAVTAREVAGHLDTARQQLALVADVLGTAGSIAGHLGNE